MYMLDIIPKGFTQTMRTEIPRIVGIEDKAKIPSALAGGLRLKKESTLHSSSFSHSVFVHWHSAAGSSFDRNGKY
jgi:hypothetical protein